MVKLIANALPDNQVHKAKVISAMPLAKKQRDIVVEFFFVRLKVIEITMRAVPKSAQNGQ